MADVSLIGSFKRLHQDRYDNYQIGRTDPRGGVARPASAVSALADDTTEPVTPIDPQETPYASFGLAVSAMGLDAYMPNGGSAVDQLNGLSTTLSQFNLNPELAAQLLGLQDESATPTQDELDGAMAALGQRYNVEAGPVSLFKQINTNGSGYIMPWELNRAVIAGGGTVEQASALMKQLDPFSNGYVTVQNMMANLPGVTPPADTDDSQTPQTDDSALGGLAALASKYPLEQTVDLFNELDTDFDGLVSENDVVNAVTDAGGSAEAGAALYAQLDPENTGSVNQGQFYYNLVPRIEVPNLSI